MTATAMTATSPLRARDRLAAALLLVLLALGALALWIAIPAASMWLASKVSDSIAGHFLVALPLTLTSMLVFAWLLYRLDRLYLRITGAFDHADDELEDADDEPRIPRGPLEPLLVGSLVIGVIAFVVWFFVFAEYPPPRVF